MAVFGGSGRDKIFSSYESIDGKLSDIQKRLGQQQDALTGTLAVDIQQLHAKIDYMYTQVTRLAEHTYSEPTSSPRDTKNVKTQNFDPKILAKLSELDRLDKLESLSKLSALSKLDDLDKLDKLEKLDSLDKLNELDQLKQLENLGYLKRLDLLNEIKLILPNMMGQTKTPSLLDEPIANQVDMTPILESLKKLSALDRIDRAQQIILAKLGSGPVQATGDSGSVSEISKRFIELVSVYREQNKVLKAQNEALQNQLKTFSDDINQIKNIILQGQQEKPKKKTTKSQV